MVPRWKNALKRSPSKEELKCEDDDKDILQMHSLKYQEWSLLLRNFQLIDGSYLGLC